MSRLIDADKLIQEMSEWYWDKEKQKAAENDVSPMDLFTHLAITTVQEQPTAFDADKVVEQLEKLKSLVPVNRVLDDIINDKPKELGMLIAYEKAIKIVKGGGVDG